MTSAAKHNGSASTKSDRADRQIVVRLLNEALATEMVYVLRYQRHHLMVRRLQAQTVARKFLAADLLEEMLANEEQHAGDLVALLDLLRREERSGFVADRPRRVDASIDYFGTGDVRRRTSSDACGEALLDGDGASDFRNDGRGKHEAQGSPGSDGLGRPHGRHNGQDGE